MQTVLPRAEIIRRESWIRGGWNLTDDDVPNVPELDPLASAQARRAQRLDHQPLPVIIGS